MKIRTQLIISMAFFGVALAIISASVIATNQQVERLSKQEELAKSIELKVGEISYLSNDYLLYHESQQIDRWESKFSSFSDDLANLTVDQPEQQVLVNNIKANRQRLKEIFGDVVSKTNSAPEIQQNTLDPAFIQVSWSRIGVQTQGIIFDASRLSDMLREQADEMENRNNLLIFALVGTFVAFLLTDYLLIYRRTLKSISNLQAGTKIIGAGNLDYFIEEKKDDEIGQLANAFNQMTIDLKRVTASKADLESEIVERKRAEQVLQKQAAMIDLSPDGTIVRQLDGIITFWSQGAESLYGWTRQDAIGQQSHALLKTQFPQPIEQIAKQVQKIGSWSGELIHRTKDDRQVVVQSRWLGQFDDQGNLTEILESNMDITMRKQAEMEIRAARDDLEQRVLDRTIELSDAKENLEVANEELQVELEHHQKLENDLFQSKQELEVANEELQVELEQHQKLEADLTLAKEAAEAAAEAKAAFLANMSHELRTPMNAVIGFSSLLLDDNLTPVQKDYIESIRKGGEALLSLINDILDVSRAEKEKIELEHQPLSLRRCIEEPLELVAPAASEKGLDLSYTVSYGTPDTIMGDHGRLRQILVNLLSNAVKFTDEGDVSISVSSKALEENRHQISFEVRDTGIGIPEDKMDRLFQPFNQVEHIISRKRDGAGLGLSISKRLVELMGGEIWAESIPAKGSKFHFTIQTEAILGKHLGLEDANKEITYKNISEQRPMSILVAEDNPSNQKVVVEMLKRMGYRPDAVADGREVLQVLQIRPYDLVLMDVKMPEMDGITATKEIRKLWPAEKQPRIVAITAYAMEGDKEMCLEAGMDDYIAKPVQKNQLEAILMKYSGEPA